MQRRKPVDLPAEPLQVVFDPTPEIYATDSGGSFSFPLLVGATCIGALDLYHDRTGKLTAEQFADAEAVAHVASRTVLAWQAVAGEGSLPWQLERVPLHRAGVHQAAGMVSVQAAVSVEDALAFLRARAFVEGLPVGTVASDVVAGRRRIEG